MCCLKWAWNGARYGLGMCWLIGGNGTNNWFGFYHWDATVWFDDLIRQKSSWKQSESGIRSIWYLLRASARNWICIWKIFPAKINCKDDNRSFFVDGMEFVAWNFSIIFAPSWSIHCPSMSPFVPIRPCPIMPLSHIRGFALQSYLKKNSMWSNIRWTAASDLCVRGSSVTKYSNPVAFAL